jgi:hypothetical protein
MAGGLTSRPELVFYGWLQSVRAALTGTARGFTVAIQHFVLATIPERFIEVDAARLLLILDRFAAPLDEGDRQLPCFPQHAVARHFTPEYYLQKLDFLVRYPGYLAYELTELHRLGIESARDRSVIMGLISRVLREREPELLTLPFRKFWRGAYERLDDVEAWWYARRLVYTGLEPKGAARPQKHYFLTSLAQTEAERLVAGVEHARWYADRIDLIQRFFGGLTATRVKELQYSHEAYRQAQLNEAIPDLLAEDITKHFALVFGEPMGVDLD